MVFLLYSYKNAMQIEKNYTAQCTCSTHGQVILRNSALKCDMQTKRQNLLINNRIHVHMKVCMMSRYIRVEGVNPFQLLIQILYKFSITLISLMQHGNQRHAQNNIVPCTTMSNKTLLFTVKQTKLSYKKESCRKVFFLKVWVNAWCRGANFYIFTLAQRYVSIFQGLD